MKNSLLFIFLVFMLKPALKAQIDFLPEKKRVFVHLTNDVKVNAGYLKAIAKYKNATQLYVYCSSLTSVPNKRMKRIKTFTQKNFELDHPNEIVRATITY